MTSERRIPCRRGLAILWVVVAFAVLSVLMVLITRQFITNRKMADRRTRQLQANLLAESGVELAVARLLDPADRYAGETVELVPDSSLRIEVHPDPKRVDHFTVTCEARLPKQGPDAPSRSVTRHVIRTREKGVIRVRVEPEPNPTS